MPDGKIIFSTELDNKGLEKDLADQKKKIQKQEGQLSDYQNRRSPLIEQSNKMQAQLDAAKSKLYEMQTASAGVFSEEQILNQKENVAVLQNQWNKVQGQVESYDRKIQQTTDELARNKEQAGEVAEQLAQTGAESQKMALAVARAEKNMTKFANRVKGLMKRVFVFTLITMALRSMRTWMSNVIKTNDEATSAIARLKGALLTMVQPLVNVVIPALTVFLNLLTAIVGEIARFVSALFGTTVEQSSEAAESLQAEVDALDETGAAAKKAGKSMASFDEINKLSNNQGGAGGSSTEPIAPDFSWADGISDKLAQIAKDVLLIGAGFALWKIASSLPGQLGTILSILGGLLIAMGGILLFYDGFTDAWENGVDWGNLAEMIAGVAAAAFGLYVIFGSMEAGIALIVGGIAMLAAGFKDVIENGTNLKNTLLIIAGIIATGLGIALITGSWIPALIAGILAVIAALVAWQGNLGELADAFQVIFNGIIDFLVGVFTGDAKRALDGLENVFRGAINSIIIAFESLVNSVIDGLNWLISKANDLGDIIGFEKKIPLIPQIELPRVPYLAQGAVIPPNREFLAVLGDQKSGTNIETPLSTMIDAFRTAMRDMNIGGGQNEAYLVVDDEVLGKIVYRLYNKEDRRVGVNLSTR